MAVKNVALIGGVPSTTSLNIAHGTQVQHKNVLALIKKFLLKFQELGGVAFKTRTLQTAGGPQQQEFVVLNEDQAVFCLTLMRNSDVAVDFKLRLVKEFRELLNELARLQEEQAAKKPKTASQLSWQEVRENGKLCRKTFVDTLKEHGVARREDYAKASDDINDVVFGMKAKQIKKEIAKVKNVSGSKKINSIRIRDHVEVVALAHLLVAEQASSNRIEANDALGILECRKSIAEVKDDFRKLMGEPTKIPLLTDKTV